MDCNVDNEPPSQLPVFSKTHPQQKLTQVSAAAINARSSGIPHPPHGTKRKPPAERGGESIRPPPPAPSSHRSNGYVCGKTIVGLHQEQSRLSSDTSRSTSATSCRAPSSGSFSSGVGSMGRSHSAQSQRPHSASGVSRNLKSRSYQQRSASSLEVYQEEYAGDESSGQGIGRTLLSSHHFPPNGAQGSHLKLPKKRQKAPPNCVSFVSGSTITGESLRDISLSTKMGNLSIDDKSASSPIKLAAPPSTPSQIPRAKPLHPPPVLPSSPSKSSRRSPRRETAYLSKETNLKSDWDTNSRLREVERVCAVFDELAKEAKHENQNLQGLISTYKARICEMENTQTQLTSKNNTLQLDLDTAKARFTSSTTELEDAKRHHRNEMEDLQRHHRHRMEDAQHDAEDQARRLLREQSEKFDDARRKLERDLDEQTKRNEENLKKLKDEGSTCQEQATRELQSQKEVSRALEIDLENSRSETAKAQDMNGELRVKMAEMTSRTASLESSVQRLESHIRFLESDNKSQSQAFADLEARMQNAIKVAAEANEKLVKEETLRRKLHNQVQELKGNIRVFCRARPSLESDSADCQAKIAYPDGEADCKEIEVMGMEEKSSLGNITTKKNAFSFDRVFGPGAQNEDVFGEISQLVQSALDGYNVCIFCYGQTGSGKTFTMSAQDGMIPRAVHQIYETAKSLEEKGWTYRMEGSFIEVYNENLNDLLGKAEEFDKKKHEIKHDLQKGKTTITGITTVDLDSPEKVNCILSRATSNRSVAATQANERSSRSHSVFILKLLGENSITGERSEGTLNLVDLAGSERLSHSGATGERLKETQNINKSLSCLGDVIGALGQGKEGTHVPYRNSKLTYLLQNSLGGNSKTLMFVMISPLQAHLSETLTSLKFATKVHNTHIGTAKKLSRA